ncbi:MAG TPA: hypothetical protein VNN20_06440 [Thermodesulfobacteriota bacterium]|nr:hypothetical protein [Thermodesulfobacteriota bacterium]
MKPLVFYRSTSVIRITPDTKRLVIWVDGALAFPDAPKGKVEKGVQKYNWEKKLSFALSPEEGIALAECAERIHRAGTGEIQFDHYPNNKNGGNGETPKKTLSLSHQKTEKGDRVFLLLAQANTKIAIPLGRSDVFALYILIPQAVSTIWNWTGFLSSQDKNIVVSRLAVINSAVEMLKTHQSALTTDMVIGEAQTFFNWALQGESGAKAIKHQQNSDTDPDENPDSEPDPDRDFDGEVADDDIPF